MFHIVSQTTHARNKNSVSRFVVYRPPPVDGQLCSRFITHASPSPPAHLKLPLDHRATSRLYLIQPQGRTCSARATLCSHSRPVVPRLVCVGRTYYSETPPPGASCPAPPSTYSTHEAGTRSLYSTEAPGRTCQHSSRPCSPSCCLDPASRYHSSYRRC